METAQSDTVLEQRPSLKSADPGLQDHLEHRLNELKAVVIDRPFFYLGVAFLAGFVSQTLPVRLILSLLTRLVLWLSGPALLVLGIVKISETFRKS